MLTRLEIDNFRCFEGFVWEPARKQLILGANGCGKSSMMDTLTNLRRFVAGDARVEELFPLEERTKWEERPDETFDIEASVSGETFTYRLIVGAGGEPPHPQIKSETFSYDGQEALVFDGVWAKIYNGCMSEPEKFLHDSHRSAISNLTFEIIEKFTGAAHAGGFREWFSGVQCFRLNPFPMVARTEAEESRPASSLSNFAGWYRHVSQLHPE